VAYGPLGLKPWEFGRLTFGEFQALAEGYQWRKEQEQVLAAGFVAPDQHLLDARSEKCGYGGDAVVAGRAPSNKPKQAIRRRQT
jgi:hypothetical protein